MKVTLVDHTQDALDLLIFTKQTRLTLTPGLFDEIKAWPMERKLEELEYMRHTIQSSWEFVDYTFLIEGVSRAFTHQLVRHRHASYAQQAQRAVDVGEFEFITGPSIDADPGLNSMYTSTMALLAHDYAQLVAHGANRQDARGVLPTNISTNIIMKTNLRSLHDMALKRLCVKAQGEAQDVFRAMVDAVLVAHPYFDKFLRVWCATYGTCMFHTFPMEQCPVKAHVYNPDSGEAYGGGRASNPDTIQVVWENNRAEAQPVVKNGGRTSQG
jgi:flavin-dependent thymidylate synthase